MRHVVILAPALLLAACNVSTDDEDSSLTVDVNEERLDEIGEDVGTIAADVGQDIEQGADNLTDQAEAEISQEANEAEAELDAEANAADPDPAHSE